MLRTFFQSLWDFAEDNSQLIDETVYESSAYPCHKISSPIDCLL